MVGQSDERLLAALARAALRPVVGSSSSSKVEVASVSVAVASSYVLFVCSVLTSHLQVTLPKGPQEAG